MRSLERVNIRTNERTYSHTYVRDRPYIPSTTLLCEGIIIIKILNIRTYRSEQTVQNEIGLLQMPFCLRPLNVLQNCNTKLIHFFRKFMLIVLGVSFFFFIIFYVIAIINIFRIWKSA